MGGGRTVKNDMINPLVGLKFFKKIGEKVSKGEDLIEIHARDEQQLDKAHNRMVSLITIGHDHVAPPPLIKKRMN
jgi:thymidine phosphorylase